MPEHTELTNRPGRPVRRPDRRHKAGALDIRNIIGGLLATYGLILVAVGLFGDAETDKTGGVNANLWAGVALLVVGGGFLLWARLKPLLVPETASAGQAAGSGDTAE
jgi:hypothetical protein